MSANQVAKNEFVKSMQADVKKAAGILFVDYTGLTVAEVEQWRKKTRAANIPYRVVKNTLLAKALKGTSAEGATKFLKGTPTGVIVGYDDPVSMAKLTMDFLKDCEHLKIKGGVLDQKPLSPKEAQALAKMPSRIEMIGQILGMIMGPGRRVAGLIKGPGSKLAGQVKTLSEKGAEDTKAS